MPNPKPTILLCSCEDSMALDVEAVRRGTGCEVVPARHLCGPELDTFRRSAAGGEVIVACTAMRALFEEVAGDEQLGATLAYANVRETAGWSKEGASAGPKMAALLAAARIADEPTAAVTYESAGVTLICGRDEQALAAADRLKDRLDITVLLHPGSDLGPPRQTDYPIRQGKVGTVTGHLGAFEITIDGYAAPRPSSRDRLAFGAQRNGAVSKADILIDLTGGAPLLSGHDLREGYLRADPDDAAAVANLLLDAADLVGTFDKPRAITFREDLCAHARSRIVGCRRCLDLCPAGAITPAGNHVAIDPHVCAGCGQCAAACPTGAASYAVPTVDKLIARLRAMLLAYRAGGGEEAQVLIHDGEHGAALIDAAARLGDGLPAHTIPLQVNETTQIGLETLAAAFAYGAASVQVLTRSKPRHDVSGLATNVGLANTLVAGLGLGNDRAGIIDTDDPDDMVARLHAAPSGAVVAAPGSFTALGGKRDVLKTVLRELHRASRSPVEVVALPKGAPLGRVVVADGCTLCLACVSACPTRALADATDHPRLSFDESLCVQCGLCAATCPEKVIGLEPRVNFAGFEAPPVVLKEEEPFCCTTCGKPFGVKSTIERVIRRLEDRHWMYSAQNKSRVDLIGMCENCRVSAAVNTDLDPFAGPARPTVRTSEDYFAERAAPQTPNVDGSDDKKS
jgi:ferredoxin